MVVLTSRDMQLGRGETPADTARVLSRYVDAIMLRTDNVAKIRELAEHATVPVINGLTDVSHPCQIMADVMTFEEHRGAIAGQVVAWTGDGNNVAQSFIQAAARFGFTLRIATPARARAARRADRLGAPGGRAIELTSDPVAAVKDARCVVTDTWVSHVGREAGRRHDQPAQPAGALPAQRGAAGAARRRMRSSCTACRRIAARRSPTR